jgi:hypothetical protein
VNWTDRDLLSSLVAETATALQRDSRTHDCHCAQLAGRSREKQLFALALCQLARRLRSETSGSVRRPDLSDDLRPEHALDRARPSGGLRLDLQKLEYALQFIPKEKFSLGPLDGYHWFAGDPGKEGKPNPTTEYIGQQDVDQYLAAYHPHLEWNFADRTAWFYFFYEKIIIPEILALHLTKVLNEPEDDSIRQLSRSRYYPG